MRVPPTPWLWLESWFHAGQVNSRLSASTDRGWPDHGELLRIPWPSLQASLGQIDQFLRLTLGEAATSRYQIIVDDPPQVARAMAQGVRKVRDPRG